MQMFGKNLLVCAKLLTVSFDYANQMMIPHVFETEK